MAGRRLALVRRFVSFVFPDIVGFVPANTPLVRPAPGSPMGILVPELVALHGRIGPSLLRFFLAVAPYLGRTAYRSRESRKSVARNPRRPQEVADARFFQELEERARALGVSAVGYTQVPRAYIFRNRTLLFPNAVVLLMDMRKDRIAKAPGLAAGKEVWRTYAALTEAAYHLAEFMRAQGYAAQPDPPVGGSVNFPLLAQKAGLGYIGKHGLLISEPAGPSQRIAAVYTNITNLPYTDQGGLAYAWIPEFCEMCNRCVRACPAGAIHREPDMREGGPRQCIDPHKCVVVFSQAYGCSICIKACPFFRGDFSRLKGALPRKARPQVVQEGA
ncbi:MAG: epoxyqueuosine reductase [Anaerolineae bacterium]|nr:epoxyqueuosine reductase [Anaerolineae bacterium]